MHLFKNNQDYILAQYNKIYNTYTYFKTNKGASAVNVAIALVEFELDIHMM